MFVCCEYCVLSGRGLCDGLITRPEESYRLWRVVVCNQETSKTRRLKPATGLWKIQPQWVVTPGKQKKKTNRKLLNRNSEIMTRIMAKRSEIRYPARARDFTFLQNIQCSPAAQNPSRWVQPHLAPGMKRPGRETENPPPTGTEIVDELIYRLLFLCVFMFCTGTTVPLGPTQV
jgi:hypothetical protein